MGRQIKEDAPGFGSPPRDAWDHSFYVCPNSTTKIEKAFLEFWDSKAYHRELESLDNSYRRMFEFQNSSDDYPGLFVVRSSRTNGRIKYKRWYLTVSKNDRFFLLPRSVGLTTRTGVIYSLARNFSDGTTRETEKLYKKLCKSSIDKISNLPEGWYKFDVIFDHIRDTLETDGLIADRCQIVSLDFSQKYLISDNPLVILKKIIPPKGVNRKNSFPMEWLVEKFSSDAYIPLLKGIAHRPEVTEATIIDILNDDRPKNRDIMFDSNPRIVKKCLTEFGFDHNFLAPLEPKTLSKLLRIALGYNTPRIPYHEHFAEISKDWDASKLFADLELRIGEVFEIWIDSLAEINGLSSRREFIGLLNEDVPHNKFNLKEPVDLGSVNIFIDLHQRKMENNPQYSGKVKNRLPERMYSLMNKKARQMLEYLSIARNKKSHAKARKREPKKYDDEIYTSWDGMLDLLELRKVRTSIEEFYIQFYGINDEVKVSSVPTMMEVIERSETNRGHRAILQCMRNGTRHSLSTTNRGAIIAYLDNAGRKKKKLQKEELQIGDRMYVWATTNPTLVDPLMFKV